MASQKVSYKNSEVKSRIFEKASSSIIDSGKAAQSIVKNSRNKDVGFSCFLVESSHAGNRFAKLLT